MKSNWTAADVKSINIMTLINGLWLGFILWLILGLWLDITDFLQCWLGATIFSFCVALNRQASIIESRSHNNSIKK